MSFCKYKNNDLSEAEHSSLKDEFKNIINTLSSNGIQIEILVNIPGNKRYKEMTKQLMDVIFPHEIVEAHDYYYLLKKNNVYMLLH